MIFLIFHACDPVLKPSAMWAGKYIDSATMFGKSWPWRSIVPLQLCHAKGASIKAMAMRRGGDRTRFPRSWLPLDVGPLPRRGGPACRHHLADHARRTAEPGLAPGRHPGARGVDRSTLRFQLVRLPRAFTLWFYFVFLACVFSLPVVLASCF